MKILAIETSCDETAASVFLSPRNVLSNVVHSQKIHSLFGGVVPELASREHLERINAVVAEALDSAKTPLEQIDVVAYTDGPGLVGSLLVGRTVAHTIAWLAGKKTFAADHIEGHALSAALKWPGLCPPFLSLVVSGGHTDLIVVEAGGKFRYLGRTRDDAAGEAFDKVAKLLGLKYPGGPQIENLAARGNPAAINFPRPFMRSTWDFSFSGVKTAVLYYLRDIPSYADGKGLRSSRKIGPRIIADVCASFQAAVVETLVEKLIRAARFTGIKKISLGGGVALNKTLRKSVVSAAGVEGLKVFLPSNEHCADNAAMIALAAYHRLSHRRH
ncbi:MAG: tRNA (adenosine(37)-N6)-threonylcarbamoyltransferase complex transferase subunit TsaD [Endomicrobiia bacterium]|nr:tRNA (adenosine(37)-N6)-threonylcarbamoyltransferase complex transferase subunit TsaD [Endomicrobiia bacterium]